MKKITLSFLLLFLTLESFSQMSATFNTTLNTICNGSPCDYEGPSILINELMISPFVNDGSLSGTGGSGNGRGEWIELYNPDLCESVDISCYYLGNHTAEGSGGFVLPPGTIVPPSGFALVRGVNVAPVPFNSLVQNGGNVVEIVVPGNVFDPGVCAGGSRLWFPNAGGWFAFYDADGVPQDAVSWANQSSVGLQPCIPPFQGCNSPISLPSYTAIPNDRKLFVSPFDASSHLGNSLRRVPDGGAWSGSAPPTYATCNATCIPPGVSTCDGTATVNVSGGVPPYTYLWNDSEAQMTATAIGLCQGVYTVTVTDDAGTISDFNVEIENFVPTVTFSIDDEWCLNDPAAGFIDFSPVPTGSEIGVFTGNGMANNLFNPMNAGAGTHTITYTFTDENECTNFAVDDVIVFPLPAVNVTNNLSPYCITEATAGLILSPTDGVLSGTGVLNNQFNPSVAGVGTHNLSFSYTDNNSCTNTMNLNVTVVDLPVLSFDIQDEVCINIPAYNLEANPTGGDFRVNGVPETQFNPAQLGVGIHIVEYDYTDANGCFNSIQMNVEVHPLPVVSLNTPSELCLDDEELELIDYGSPVSGVNTLGEFLVNGILTQVFNPANVGAGNHTVIYAYTDENQCVNMATEEIVVNALPEISVTNNLSPYCISETNAGLVLSPVNGILSGDGVVNNQMNPSLAGVGTHPLQFTYTDANGCTNTLNLNVVVVDLPTLVINTPDFLCINNEEISLTASPEGGVFTVNGANAIDFNPGDLGEGVYTIGYTYTDLNGCTNSTQKPLDVIPLPVIDFIPNHVSECPPVSIPFQNQSGNQVSCLWDFGDGSTSMDCGMISHAFYASGCYDVSLTLTSTEGCVNYENYEDLICVYPMPNADFISSSDVIKVDGTEIGFINQSSENSTSYIWDFGDGSPISNELHNSHIYAIGEPNAYLVKLIVITDDGCIDSTSRVISVQEEPIFYVPNSFTPDDDKFNQFFQPVFSSGFDMHDFNLIIFNRWGEVVFESNNANVGWDGNYGGKKSPDGTYMWFIEFKESRTDKRHKETGHVNLLR